MPWRLTQVAGCTVFSALIGIEKEVAGARKDSNELQLVELGGAKRIKDV
jgi:hypothetical protein